MIEDPLRGLAISANSVTSHDAVILDASKCSVLTGESHDTTSTLSPPTILAGEYTVDCEGDGSHLVGHVAFDDCM